jgi:hypothetical protein
LLVELLSSLIAENICIHATIAYIFEFIACISYLAATLLILSESTYFLACFPVNEDKKPKKDPCTANLLPSSVQLYIEQSTNFSLLYKEAGNFSGALQARFCRNGYSFPFFSGLKLVNGILLVACIC